MVTMVGRESDSKTLIKNLIQLEHDAIAAYDAVIERLDDPGRAEKIRSFRSDHTQHLEELNRLAGSEHAYNPGEGSMKSMLTTGKVAFADMTGGDGAILKAMSTNETDTVTAYRNASENSAAPEAARPFFEKALADEERHKAWMDNAAAAA
jgi:rubrerythrin